MTLQMYTAFSILFLVLLLGIWAYIKAVINEKKEREWDEWFQARSKHE